MWIKQDSFRNCLETYVNSYQEVCQINVDTVIRKSPHITQADIAAKIECSERKVKRLMKKMVDQGMIERVGGRKMGQ